MNVERILDGGRYSLHCCRGRLKVQLYGGWCLFRWCMVREDFTQLKGTDMNEFLD